MIIITLVENTVPADRKDLTAEKGSASNLKCSYRLAPAFLLLIAYCFACTPQDVTGTYLASVPFRGADPRFTGQDFQWQLTLEQNGSFSFTFELPLAVYTEEGQELIGKGKSEVRGQWKQSASWVVLSRDSGDTSLGSQNTMSFSIQENQLIIQVRDGKAILMQAGNQLVLVKNLVNR